MGHEDVERIAALIKQVATGPHGADGRAQPARGRQALATASPCSRAARCSPRATTRPCRRTPRVDQPPYLRDRRMAEPLLAVKDLQAWYGESHVLHGVDFEVRTGEVVTLLGRNGAGKTTTLKSIMGLVRAAHGLGQDRRRARRSGCRPYRIARLGIAFCPEERGIFSSLNVEENLLLPPTVREGGLSTAADLRAVPEPERAAAQPGHASCPAASSRCSRSAASCAPARGLLLLDEPTEGLAPVIVQQIGSVDPQAEAATASRSCWSSRTSASPRRVADRHYVMEHGRIVDEIPNAALQGNMDKLSPVSRSVKHRQGSPTHETHDIAVPPRPRSRCRCSAPRAQITDNVIKIGVLNDLSGLYADLAGQGSVAAAKMAVEDFGKIPGIKVEVVFADHQNKPDVGVEHRPPVVRRGRRRRDRRRADLVGGARRQPGHAGQEQGLHRLRRRRRRDLTGQGVLAEHGALDLRHVDARATAPAPRS